MRILIISSEILTFSDGYEVSKFRIEYDDGCLSNHAYMVAIYIEDILFVVMEYD